MDRSGESPGPDEPLTREFRLHVTASGYRRFSTEWERFADGRFDREFLMAMDREVPATLRGHVEWPDGKPCEGGLAIRVSQENGSSGFEETVHHARADARGDFRVVGLPTGRRVVSVSPGFDEAATDVFHMSFLSASKVLDLVEGGVADAAFVLPPAGHLVLKVVGQDGAEPEKWSTGIRGKSMSGTAGTIRRITNVQPGEYALEVEAEGFDTCKREVLVRVGEETTVDFVMAAKDR